MAVGDDPMQLWTAPTDLWTAGRHCLLGGHLDGDGELDLGMELGRHAVGAGGLDVLVEVEVSAVDLDAGLGLHRLGDVGGGDRTEELALGPGLGRDGDDVGTSLLATSWAALRCAASLVSRERRMEAAWFSAPFEALSARPFGSRKLRA
jgi:hypothetical protein